MAIHPDDFTPDDDPLTLDPLPTAELAELADGEVDDLGALNAGLA